MSLIGWELYKGESVIRHLRYYCNLHIASHTKIYLLECWPVLPEQFFNIDFCSLTSNYNKQAKYILKFFLEPKNVALTIIRPVFHNFSYHLHDLMATYLDHSQCLAVNEPEHFPPHTRRNIFVLVGYVKSALSALPLLVALISDLLGFIFSLLLYLRGYLVLNHM